MDVNTHSDFTISVDRDGLVIYFSINGHRFFLNGHNGFFSDSIPDYADEAFKSLSKPKREQIEVFDSIRRRYGYASEALLKEIALYQNGSHPDLALEQRQENFSKRMSPKIFTVYLAQNCNMDCAYCFSRGGTFGNRSSQMSKKTAELTLDFISNIAQSGEHKTIGVLLFGGEPLLAPDAACILARGFQDFSHQNYSSKINTVVITNGTIYNKKLFDIIAERPKKCSVVVSLDAFKSHHDRNRPFRNPKQGSSYDSTLKNLQRMMRENIPYSVTCIVPYPYDFIASAKQLHSLGIRRLEIKQLIRYIYGESALTRVFKHDFKTWRKEYISYSDFYIDYLGQPEPVPHVDRFALVRDYTRNFRQEDKDNSKLACPLGDAKVAITSDGEIMACESCLGHEKFHLGNVQNGFDKSKYETFQDWILSKGQLRLDHERCRSCYAKLICGGGCYAQSYDKTEQLNPYSESTCRYMKEMVKIDLYYLSRLRHLNPDMYSQMLDPSIKKEHR
jgi:uncharacterized protein